MCPHRLGGGEVSFSRRRIYGRRIRSTGRGVCGADFHVRSTKSKTPEDESYTLSPPSHPLPAVNLARPLLAPACLLELARWLTLWDAPCAPPDSPTSPTTSKRGLSAQSPAKGRHPAVLGKPPTDPPATIDRPARDNVAPHSARRPRTTGAKR